MRSSDPDKAGTDTRNCFLSTKLLIQDNEAASGILYFDVPKNLNLSVPVIKQKITQVDNGFEIELTSDRLAKNVFLTAPYKGDFSDNYVDLIPGEPKKILFRTESKNLKFTSTIKVRSLVDTY